MQSQLGLYTLRLYDTGATDLYGKAILAYELLSPANNIIFKDNGFHYPLTNGDVGNDRTLKIILDWLTLCKEDKDAQYFKNYTIPQKLFRDTVAKELSMYAAEGVPFDEEVPDDFDEVSTAPYLRLPDLF